MMTLPRGAPQRRDCHGGCQGGRRRHPRAPREDGCRHHRDPRAEGYAQRVKHTKTKTKTNYQITSTYIRPFFCSTKNKTIPKPSPPPPRSVGAGGGGGISLKKTISFSVGCARDMIVASGARRRFAPAAVSLVGLRYGSRHAVLLSL